MSDSQATTSPLGNGVETKEQSLLQALTYLRTELAKVQNENNELSSERTVLLEQLSSLEKQKQKVERADGLATELQAQIKQIEEEKKAIVHERDNLKVELEKTLEEKSKAQIDYENSLQTQGRQIQQEKTKLEQERNGLLAQLEQTRNEKTQLEAQYQSLLAKLTTVKTSLADKLKGDMDELKQARQQVANLNQQNQDLSNTISQLQSDITVSHSEQEKTSQELENVRSQILKIQQQSASEIAERDNAIREFQANLESVEHSREEWEATAMEEKGLKDEMLARVKHMEREVEILKNEKEAINAEKENESESLSNLQAVLEEFQAAKESEIREAVEGTQRKLSIATNELSEYKERAILAENQLSQIKEEFHRTQQYEKEIKEKNLLIGKLRHEAVILNEHLTEALRRMREESSDNNVDKRLITNLLIAFFNTPRGDSKRFEILQLMSNMLQWSDEQREQVGLIRKSITARFIADDRPRVSGLWTPTTERPLSRKSEEVPRSNSLLTGMDEFHRESFSDMWISFLLKEASKDSSNQTSTDNNDLGVSNSGDKSTSS